MIWEPLGTKKVTRRGWLPTSPELRWQKKSPANAYFASRFFFKFCCKYLALFSLCQFVGVFVDKQVSILHHCTLSFFFKTQSLEAFFFYISDASYPPPLGPGELLCSLFFAIYATLFKLHLKNDFWKEERKQQSMFYRKQQSMYYERNIWFWLQSSFICPSHQPIQKQLFGF